MGRWKAHFDDVPRLKPIRAALNAALKAHDDIRERATEVSKNANLSPLGRLDDVRGFISKTTAPAIQRSRRVAKSTRDDLAAWRARLRPKPIDPKDLTSAAMASEMRTYLRSLSKIGAASLLTSQDADPALIQAVLQAPSFLSGINDELRQRVLDNYVNRTHSNDLAQIAQTEEAVELLEAAVGIVFGTAKSAAEFPSDKVFSDFIDRAAPPVDPVLPRVESVPDWQKRSDDFHARILAEARAEIAAL
jgi:hypothetical protein